MKILQITQAARYMLATQAKNVLGGIKELPSGLVEIQVDDDVAEKLATIHEDPSEAIMLLCDEADSTGYQP